MKKIAYLILFVLLCGCSKDNPGGSGSDTLNIIGLDYIKASKSAISGETIYLGYKFISDKLVNDYILDKIW